MEIINLLDTFDDVWESPGWLKIEMQGYFDLVRAMALSPVDSLSEPEGGDTTKPPEAKAGPKVKAKAKSKSKVGKPAASESAASAAVPKGKAKAKSVAKPKASPKPPAPTTVLKRPSALKAVSAAEPPGGERLTDHKGLYKDGKYGFKVNGREVYRVPRLKLVLIYM